MGRMDGKTAVVTGGASGIGEATVRRFVAEGARVVIADMQEDRGAALAAELGDAAVFVRCNVVKEEQVAAAVDAAVDRWGRLDTMFNNAGFGGAMGPISSISEEDYDLTMDVLLKGPFFGVKHAAPVMQRQQSGSIVNTASVCGLRAGIGSHVYTIAKAGVISLTQTAALELAEDNVRVNAVCPGYTITPLYAGKPDASAELLDRRRQQSAMAQPMHRAGDPTDIASMVLFLASDESPWVTGQAHVVDGGLIAGTAWRKQPSFMKEAHPIRLHRPPND
ncbi:MAG: SDR family NAD(P)-dependent oxidoreductase [Acidimicrobiales bacterium]